MVKAVRANLQEALRVTAGNGSEEDKLEARIEAECSKGIVYKSIISIPSVAKLMGYY